MVCRSSRLLDALHGQEPTQAVDVTEQPIDLKWLETIDCDAGLNCLLESDGGGERLASALSEENSLLIVTHLEPTLFRDDGFEIGAAAKNKSMNLPLLLSADHGEVGKRATL